MNVDPAHLGRPSGLSVTEHRRLKVAHLVFEDVDVLDFAIPSGVFSAADERGGGGHFHVYTVAESPCSLRTRQGLKLVPDFALEHTPRPDVLVIPGGSGTRSLLGRPGLLEWIRTRSASAVTTLGVGAGVLLLAKAGLLAGTTVTSHGDCLDELRSLAPEARVEASRRYHLSASPSGHGHIVTAAGFESGFDAAIQVVRLLLGADLAEATERHLELGRFARPE